MSAASEQYFNSLTPAQQSAARATGAAPGGPNHDAWFANAQKAGAVGAVNNPGGGGVGTEKGQAGGGNSAGRVTAADVRANAQKYGLPEDYQRFSDAEINDWLRRWDYNPNTGKFTNKWGDQVDKPDERGPNTPAGMNGTGDRGNYGAGGGQAGGPGGPGGGGQAGGYQPANPVTFGDQLSMTGNPMTDMLIHQFNTRANLDGRGSNIFGLGEDRAVGGEGANADKQNIMGQLLEGGGLWWGGEGFNQGYRADLAAPAAPAGRTGRPRGAQAPSPAAIAAPPPAAAPPPTTSTTPAAANSGNPTAFLPTFGKDVMTQSSDGFSGIPGMLSNKYDGIRMSGFGGQQFF